jgi:hypothetical protein
MMFCSPFAVIEFRVPPTASHKDSFAKLVRANTDLAGNQVPTGNAGIADAGWLPGTYLGFDELTSYFQQGRTFREQSSRS